MWLKDPSAGAGQEQWHRRHWISTLAARRQSVRSMDIHLSLPLQGGQVLRQGLNGLYLSSVLANLFLRIHSVYLVQNVTNLFVKLVTF